MVRTFLFLGFLASQLAVSQLAFCRPPDQVVNSPIPPLKEPTPRRAPRAVTKRPVVKQPVADHFLPSLVPQSKPVLNPQHDAAPKEAPRGPKDYLTEQTEIWNSPAMREARSLVMEFSRRSAQTSAQEGDRFIQQLSMLPPAEMKSWLKRYLERRTKIALEREVEQFARQLMVEHALNRQDAMRQAFAHVSQLRAEAAAMQMQPGIVRSGYLHDTLTLDLQPGYDPMYPVVDPAMHMAEKILRVPIEQAAAAASLPGDLPRDDPQNYDPNAGDSGE